MSKYHLTEAYGNLYNPRKADETFYENLRFVDYLMQEEIEEVMESLLWEFMDYGNTLDESYDLIEGVFSDDVILEEVLYEARMSPQRMAQRQAERQATLQQVAGEKKQARREARKAAVKTALRDAGKAVQSAATSTGSAAMSAMRAGKQAAASAYDRAKGLPGRAMAALKGLVRKGATAAGRRMEKSGEQARMQAQTAAGGASYGGSSALERSRARTAGLEAAGKTGSKRQVIGRLLRKAGAIVGRAGRGSSGDKPMSRGDYEQRKANRAAAARQAADDVVASSGRPHGPFQQSTTRPQGPFQQNTTGIQGPTQRRGKGGVRPSDPWRGSATTPSRSSASSTTSTRALPPARSGVRPSDPWRGSATTPSRSSSPSTTSTRAITGSTPKASLPASGQTGGSTKKGNILNPSQRQTKNTAMLRRATAEEFELLAQYIMEDFINEGYADTYEEALEILENLSESSIVELTEMYLEG